MRLGCSACLICIIAAFFAGAPGNVGAQAAPVARATVSGAVGVAEGAVVALAIAVARARFQEKYVESAGDLIGWNWRSVPLLVGPLEGITFGLAGDAPFANSIVGSASGFVIGATAGAVIGRLVSDSPESTWAGGIIGAGAGITVGRLLMGVLNWNDDGSESRSVPVVFYIAI